MGSISQFNLVPPGADGANFDYLVTNAQGVPLGSGPDPGKVIAAALGWPDADSLGSSLDELIDLAGMCNISVTVWGGESGQDPVQAQLDFFDPTNPSVPIMRQQVEISRDALRNGLVTGAETQDAARTAAGGNTASAAVAAPRGNPWLRGSVYVSFLIQFMEMNRILMGNKAVQGEIEIRSNDVIVSLAESTAKAILAAAKMQQAIHIAAAVMAGVSIGLAVASLGGMARTGGQMVRNSKPINAAPTNTTNKKINAQNQAANEGKIAQQNTRSQTLTTRQQMFQTVATLGMSMNQFVTSTVNAALEVPKAEIEGKKEMLNAYRQVVQHMMEKATERFKQDTEMIAQLIQSLDSIRQKLQEAVANSLRK